MVGDGESLFFIITEVFSVKLSLKIRVFWFKDFIDFSFVRELYIRS